MAVGADQRDRAVSGEERKKKKRECGLRAGWLLRALLDCGWAGSALWPLSIFFVRFPFSNFLFSEKQITFEIIVQTDSNHFG